MGRWLGLDYDISQSCDGLGGLILSDSGSQAFDLILNSLEPEPELNLRPSLRL
jgi:hypothetical protein